MRSFWIISQVASLVALGRGYTTVPQNKRGRSCKMLQSRAHLNLPDDFGVKACESLVVINLSLQICAHVTATVLDT